MKSLAPPLSNVKSARSRVLDTDASGSSSRGTVTHPSSNLHNLPVHSGATRSGGSARDEGRARRTPCMRSTCSAALAATLLASALPGCGGGGDDWSGAIDIDGSSTVFQISQAAREAYDREHPEVTVVVDNHGTGGGFNNYLKGEVDIVDASRPAKPDEEARARAQGIDWTRFVVGYDGITVAVHPRND